MLVLQPLQQPALVGLVEELAEAVAEVVGRGREELVPQELVQAAVLLLQKAQVLQRRREGAARPQRGLPNSRPATPPWRLTRPVLYYWTTLHTPSVDRN